MHQRIQRSSNKSHEQIIIMVIIGVKQIYKTKLNPDGSILKYKVRLAVKGYLQQPGNPWI